MRPIDADALRDKLQEECSECGNCSYYNPDGNCHSYMMLNILEEDAPTIDAVPEVLRAEWRIEGILPICSNCDGASPNTFRYCPHCGAKMTAEN